LRQAYADLEKYKKVVEKQLDRAGKKLAENVATIQKLIAAKKEKIKRFLTSREQLELSLTWCSLHILAL
jgi:hypothetical protein